jgi:phosphatidate cytidylyltransferase
MQRVIWRPALLEGEKTVTKRAPTELMVRLFSALILIAAAVALTLTSVETFAALITVFIAAMAWEWARLVRGAGFDFIFGAQLVSTVAASWTTAQGYPVSALLIVAAGAVFVLLVQRLDDARSLGWWSAAGVLYAGLPAIALIWLRSDGAYGVLAVLYLFAVVWTTDSAGYLFGRMVGGPKLAPRISPSKTWAGFIGATASAGVAGLVFGYATQLDGAWLAAFGVALALIAQFGDLGESAVKRAFGMKDSSGLIPGHGGVLDRIDGLVFGAVAAAALAWIIDPAHPGQAILFRP